MLFVVVMGTVWSVVIATNTGARTIPPIYARAARTMGSEGFDKWTRVILPAALPFVVSGMKQGWAFAWRSLMAAEIFVTILTGFGLGQLLQYGRELSAMDQVIGVMVMIVVIGLIADKALFSPWERFLHRRWGTGLKSESACCHSSWPGLPHHYYAEVGQARLPVPSTSLFLQGRRRGCPAHRCAKARCPLDAYGPGMTAEVKHYS